MYIYNKTKYDIKYNPASFHFKNINMYKYLYCSVAYISVACPTYKKLVAGKMMFTLVWTLVN